MKKLICANQATYDVCEETVCYPSGSANARNYLELWLPQDAMSFDEFEALCKNSAAMASVHIQTADGAGVAAFDGYTVPAEIAKSALSSTTPPRAKPRRKCACLPAWSSLPSLSASWRNWG